MALFLSTYVNKVDKKGRVSVPAQFRNEIARQDFQGIIVFRSPKQPALECFTREQMELLSRRINEFDLFSDTQDDLASTILGDSLQLSFDVDGRIVLPKEFADYAGVGEHAAFCGKGSTFQIWKPETLKKVQDDARKRIVSAKITIPKERSNSKEGIG